MSKRHIEPLVTIQAEVKGVQLVPKAISHPKQAYQQLHQ